LNLRLVLLLLAGVTAARAAITPGTEAQPFTAREIAQGYREHSLLAKPRGSARATVDADEAREGLDVRQKFARFGDLRVLALPDTDSADRAVERLRATGRYEFVERDLIRHADVVPGDAKFSSQWALQNNGQSGGRVGADISATTAWDTLHDAPNVIVAVIDSGALLNHGDLAPNLWLNQSPAFGDDNGARAVSGRGTLTGSPIDDYGHGTHVAGIIGAVGDNGAAGAGVTGVAWKVQLMILKFLNSAGTGSLSDEVACLYYAISHGAQIINGSFGETGGSQLSASEQAVIAAARDAGIIFVAAAGNDAANMDVSPHYPASLPLDNIVAVGSSTRLEDRSTFSNYGSGAVELFAPGEQILSTYYTGITASATFSGTSMAAPMVSGALALLKQKFPNDTYRQLINRLLRTTDARAAYAGYCQTGGRLNLAAALASKDNRPFNDDFETRGRLVGTSVATRSNNAGATAQTGEPAFAGVAPSGTLWWEWTAPTTSTVDLDTSGSSYDTVLAVATGTTLAALTTVSANDDDGGLPTSHVSFTAQAGTTYQISVSGKAGATGFTKVNLSVVPPNDNFAHAQVLTGPSALVTANNAGAGRESAEPRILGHDGGRSLWYKWTAPTTQTFHVAVDSADLDPLAAVYTGSSLGGLTLVAASDNAYTEANPDSTVTTETSAVCTFAATAGTTYYFTVDAKPPSGGSAVLLGTFHLSLTDSLWLGLTSGAVTCTPAVAPDGSVYVGSNDGTLYAFKADGSPQWTSTAANGYLDTASAAIADDGTLYVGSSGTTGSDARVTAFNPDGSIKWAFAVPAPATNATTNSISNAAALAADGTIYLKGDDGYLYALNPADGTQKWRFNTHGVSYGSASVAPDGTIYVPSGDNFLYAVNPADGSQKWSYEADNQLYTAPAIDAAGNLYFGSLGTTTGATTVGVFYSLTSAGALRWKYSTAGAITSSPALSPDGGTVYFGCYDLKLHAVSTATGAARWTFPLGDQVRASSPAVDAHGVIYLGCYDNLLYAVNADGTLQRTYPTGDWIRSSPVISGSRLYFGSNDHRVYAYDLGVGAALGPWPQFHFNSRHLGRAIAPAPAPTITTDPRTQTVGLGGGMVLSVAATGTGPFAYQWSRNGTAIAGATAATYTVASATAATAGSYTVAVTSNGGGTTTSAAAVITTATATPALLTNLSVLTGAGPGAQKLTVGFVLRGDGGKTLVVRGIGPGLSIFGVSNVLVDPTLSVIGPSPSMAVAASNNDWNPSDTTAMAATGAFALAPDSKDAAVVTSLNAGNYTAEVSGATAGQALAEIYDTTSGTGARLINLSTLSAVAAGGTLTAGFTISGNVAKTVLIRGIGPALFGFGIRGELTLPKLSLFDGRSNFLQSNTGWGATPALLAAFSQTGAFSLGPSPTADTALLVTLAPGGYTAQITGADGQGGTALIEVYEVP
jgi:outer membrane protein assembly factor BamB